MVNVTGTLDNTGTTLPLNATTGSWNLAGGTISGGTVTFAAGQDLGITADGNNRLLNVTVSGDLTLSATNARVKIEGTTTFANAHLSGANASLGFGPGTTLTGNVLFEGGDASTRAVEMNGNAGTFTIGPTGSIRTVAGFGGPAQI